MHRFFAPALDPGDETVVLPRDEAEHLTRVLRLGVGDTVAVFDGRGHEFLARVVVAAARRDVRVQLLSRVEPAARAGRRRSRSCRPCSRATRWTTSCATR